MPLLAAAALAVSFASFCGWHAQWWRGRLTAAEVDRLVAAVARVPAPDAPEMDGFLARLRAWAEDDDGRPFYMLNPMRYAAAVRRFEGFEFDGTPAECNRRYERGAAPLLLAHGAYPVFMGRSQARRPLVAPPRTERAWDRVVVIRFPSRRAFLQVGAHPAYAALGAHKLLGAEFELLPLAGAALLGDWAVVGLVGALHALAYRALGGWGGGGA
jgi:hypothetical protein